MVCVLSEHPPTVPLCSRLRIKWSQNTVRPSIPNPANFGVTDDPVEENHIPVTGLPRGGHLGRRELPVRQPIRKDFKHCGVNSALMQEAAFKIGRKMVACQGKYSASS